ncbi:MAG: HD domain-containing protein [Candidatus Thorarchaeota archaeon]
MNYEFEQRIREMVLASTHEEALKEWIAVVDIKAVPPYNYRGDHVKQVVATARFLATQTGADINIVTIAAWLHDIAKPGLGNRVSEDHGIAGAKIAANLLTSEGFPEDVIERVGNAISKHVGLTLAKPLDSIEAQVLWEADKLVKLGSIGFIHYIMNGILLRPEMTLFDIAESVSSFIPLAEKIVASMVTPPAKRLAQDRLKVLKLIVASLKNELFMED